MERFGHAASPNFDPARDLQRIGVANQTTMLARESLAIGELIGRSMARASGEEYAREKAMRIRIPVEYDGVPPRPFD